VSPTIFRSGGYRFYFFSREAPRMHVHAHHETGEAKFWLEPEIAVAQNYGLSPARLTAALRLCRSTKMKSGQRGRRTSAVEVTNVSPHGFWLLLGDRELFLAFDEFPWFRDAPIAKLVRVQQPSSHHLYWPDLDVDLAVESIEHPERFPLTSKMRSNSRLQRTPARGRR